MNVRKILIMLCLTLIAATLLTGCGQGSGSPGEKEIGAPVYPGSEYTGNGTLKTVYKFTSEDPAGKVVNWYRKELKGKAGFSETNAFKEATTGDAINYREGGKTFWITILPGMNNGPTKLEISVNKTL